ncbi:hypothetical protein ATY41_04215 [Leifsonia xyli subsp. xyli]|uniref:Membrane protein n=2 Tax=Leifsonia xyli subsp. xyli TaxID=59736 RepID=Q6AE54_LEIXX|nr:DUF3040 domain-containing protein [Leifsonia xyli]AAT89342.1 membrane protein [Leifsonia xyli subsp. xyli str. CTCB07]ODA89669.1 hypothetical protein ATY41_04215 [Leifsonia xyli subsp. xyli]
MPLSEHEQRLLEEMERSLYQNDADFVAKVGGKRARPAYRSIVLGVLVAVAGVAVLVTGVFVQQPVVGLLGFVVMFAGVLLAIAPGKRIAVDPDAPAQTPGKPVRNQSGFMDRLNDRWDKRNDGPG